MVSYKRDLAYNKMGEVHWLIDVFLKTSMQLYNYE